MKADAPLVFPWLHGGVEMYWCTSSRVTNYKAPGEWFAAVWRNDVDWSAYVMIAGPSREPSFHPSEAAAKGWCEREIAGANHGTDAGPALPEPAAP